MITLFKTLFSFLAGGPLDRILTSVDKKMDNGTERERIRAGAIERHIEIAAETRQAAMVNRMFWRVWALFAIPLGLWFGAICLDSVFGFSGGISDLPESVKPYANQIFYSVFGSGASVGIVQSIASAIRGRR